MLKGQLSLPLVLASGWL